MAEKHDQYVHGEIVRELMARRMGLMNERAQLAKAQERIAEIDAIVAALDVEIARSQVLVEPVVAAEKPL